MKYKTCFILMPFTKTETLKQDDLDFIYNDILKKAVAEYNVKNKKYFDVIERFNNKVGSIVSGIVNNLNSADLVIADLTGLNPNVMYELGVRHSLRRGTIIISQNLDKLPSDLRDYMTVGYKYSESVKVQPQNFNEFKIELHKTIDEVLNTNKYDSPVLSYLQQKKRFRDEEEIENLKTNVIIVDAIHNEFYEIEDMIKALEETRYQGQNELLQYQLFNLKLNNLTTALTELKIPYNSSILYENIINSRTLLAEMNKMFSMNEYFILFKSIPGLPDGVFGTSDLQGCIEKPFVNIINLRYEDQLKYTSMKELFKLDGVLKDELLDYLIDYIEGKAKQLGVEPKELKKILES